MRPWRLTAEEVYKYYMKGLEDKTMNFKEIMEGLLAGKTAIDPRGYKYNLTDSGTFRTVAPPGEANFVHHGIFDIVRFEEPPFTIPKEDWNELISITRNIACNSAQWPSSGVYSRLDKLKR